MDKKETKRTIYVRNVIPFLVSPGLAGVNRLLHRYAEPVVMMNEDILRKNVTVPIKRKVGLPIISSVKTERDFSDAFLDTLDSINISQLDRQVSNWREKTENGDTVRIAVKGSMYTPNYGGSYVKRSIAERIAKPLYQIETTLGSYLVHATKNDIITTDTYDWDTKVHLDESSVYGFMRNAMNILGTADSTQENEKIKILIKSKRNK